MGEPGQNAVGMVEMLARQLLGFGIEEELVLADGAEE